VTPETVLDAYQQFVQQTVTDQTNPRLVNNLRTTLRHLLVSQHGFEKTQLRSDLDSCLAKIPLEGFIKDAGYLVDSPIEFEKLTSFQGASAGAICNYRSVLQRFITWVEKRWDITSPSIPTPNISTNGNGSRGTQKNQTKLSNRPYTLKETQLPTPLQTQLKELSVFWLSHAGAAKYGETPLQEATFKVYKSLLLNFLGWLQNIQGMELEQLDLADLTQLAHLEAFIEWGIEQKGNSYGWATNVTQSALLVAKWQATLQDVNNLEQISEIQEYGYLLRNQYYRNSRSLKAQEPLTSEQWFQILQYLRDSRGEYSPTGKKRTELAIMKSWQRYLVIALLLYFPLKQKEVSSLTIASLVQQPDGSWLIKLPSQSPKNNLDISKQYALPSELAQDLTQWLKDWRPKIVAQHDLIFVRLGSEQSPEATGQPLTDRDIWEMVSRGVYKATSVLLPHPLRLNPQTLRSVKLANQEQRKDSPKIPLSVTTSTAEASRDLEFDLAPIEAEVPHEGRGFLTRSEQRKRPTEVNQLNLQELQSMAGHLKAVLEILYAKIPEAERSQPEKLEQYLRDALATQTEFAIAYFLAGKELGQDSDN
jgi:hypothetical protein